MSLGESLTAGISIVAACSAMLIAPVVMVADKNDSMTQSSIQTETTNFTNNILTTGVITQENYDNLILTFEHREGERDNFYFYPEANLEIASNFNLSFEGSKLEPVAGLFKNQEYIYETILTNVKRKLESHNEVSDSKKR